MRVGVYQRRNDSLPFTHCISSYSNRHVERKCNCIVVKGIQKYLSSPLGNFPLCFTVQYSALQARVTHSQYVEESSVDLRLSTFLFCSTRATNRSSFPRFACPHVEVFLGKTLNPNLLPMVVPATCVVACHHWRVSVQCFLLITEARLTYLAAGHSLICSTIVS